MRIFSFHLVMTSPATTARAMCAIPNSRNTAGLVHAECMAAMTLGSAIFSPERILLHRLAFFAAWQSESNLDAFLEKSVLGQTLAAGWHVRMEFLRRWGSFSQLDDVTRNPGNNDPGQPVVAVTLARLKLPEVYRFVRWGKPVEKLVRDHPATTLALAAMRPPRTFSTFSVWRSQREMTDMVCGHGSAAGAERHAAAMEERQRKEFHHEFATFRFRTLSEHGVWEGRRGIVPN